MLLANFCIHHSQAVALVYLLASELDPWILNLTDWLTVSLSGLWASVSLLPSDL